MHTHDITDTVSMITCCGRGRGRGKKEVLGVCKGVVKEKKAMKKEMDRQGVYGNKAFVKKMKMAYKVEALINPKGGTSKSRMKLN